MVYRPCLPRLGYFSDFSPCLLPYSLTDLRPHWPLHGFQNRLHTLLPQGLCSCSFLCLVARGSPVCICLLSGLCSDVIFSVRPSWPPQITPHPAPLQNLLSFTFLYNICHHLASYKPTLEGKPPKGRHCICLVQFGCQHLWWCLAHGRCSVNIGRRNERVSYRCCSSIFPTDEPRSLIQSLRDALTHPHPSLCAASPGHTPTAACLKLIPQMSLIPRSPPNPGGLPGRSSTSICHKHNCLQLDARAHAMVLPGWPGPRYYTLESQRAGPQSSSCTALNIMP